MIPVGAKPARRRYGPRKSTAQLALVAESTGGYEEDERYTQAVTLAVCRRLAGVDAYDLDVAACAEAHCASTWCSRENSGLEQEWFGNVWCNPPYSDIRPWIERAWQQMTDGSCVTVSMLLPSSRCEHLPEWSAAAGTTAIHRHSPPSETQVTGNGGKMVTHGAK